MHTRNGIMTILIFQVYEIGVACPTAVAEAGAVEAGAVGGAVGGGEGPRGVGAGGGGGVEVEDHGWRRGRGGRERGVKRKFGRGLVEGLRGFEGRGGGKSGGRRRVRVPPFTRMCEIYTYVQ